MNRNEAQKQIHVQLKSKLWEKYKDLFKQKLWIQLKYAKSVEAFAKPNYQICNFNTNVIIPMKGSSKWDGKLRLG